MVRSRILPVLLLSGNGLVKTKRFKPYKYVGDPINAIKIFNEKKVDELCVFDIGASSNESGPNFPLLQKISAVSNMPLTYGGGVSTAEEARRLIKIGFEKVSVNSSLFKLPNVLEDISSTIGAQSTVVCLDVKLNFLGKPQLFTDRGTIKSDVDFWLFVKELSERGCGELIVSFIDRDGTRSGLEASFASKLRKELMIPVTIVGGADSLKSVFAIANELQPIGIGVGALFVFQGKYDAVMINYAHQRKIENG